MDASILKAHSVHKLEETPGLDSAEKGFLGKVLKKDDTLTPDEFQQLMK